MENIVSGVYTLAGNFSQSGRWSTPDPSFTGPIFVQEDGFFFGVQTELFDRPSHLPADKYINGYIGTSGLDTLGICFYKLMPNEERYSPISYLVPDLASTGKWLAISGGTFQPQGDARVTLTPTDEQDHAQVLAAYEHLSLSDTILVNQGLLEQIGCCKDLLENFGVQEPAEEIPRCSRCDGTTFFGARCETCGSCNDCD